jgi:uncharacterized protein with PIN domain
VKDVIEAAGIPHVEVALILRRGAALRFEERVTDGDRVAVFGAVAARLRPDVAAPTAAGGSDVPRFVVDGHLGRLAAYLRMLGFDTRYANDAPDAALARLAAEEDRILLSRDVGLLKRSAVRRGYWPRSDHPHQQLLEVAARYGLAGQSRPFRRCLRCNGLLEPLDVAVARPLVPPRVAREQDTFRRCPDCGALYWRGSHHARMRRLIERLVPEASVAVSAPAAASPAEAAEDAPGQGHE